MPTPTPGTAQTACGRRRWRSCDAGHRPTSPRRTGGVITVGADCAGLLSEALALDYLGVEHKHKFAAEPTAKLRQLLCWKLGKGSLLFYRTGILRDNTKSDVPRVHL